MSPDEFREFCKGRFAFKELTVMRYENARERGEAQQERRANAMLKRSGFELDYAQLKKRNDPGDVLLSSASGNILIDMTPVDLNKRNAPRKPFLLNPMGKTTVAVLNEFIQRLVKGTLNYEAEDTRSVSQPYRATAMLALKRTALREMGNCRESLTVLCEIAAMSEDRNAPGFHEEIARFPIGTGCGGNKKISRLAAAKDALSKLLPKLLVNDDYICEGVIKESDKKDFDEISKQLLKQISIDAEGLVSLCTKCTIPKPYTLLMNAVNRSMRWDGEELRSTKEVLPNGQCKVVLELAGMTEEATGTGMKHAQQNAAQLLFKRMHPELTAYGSFLELYGRLEDKDRLEAAKKQHDEVVRLQDTGNLLRPNHIVLGKLVEEMKKTIKVTPARQFLFGNVAGERIGVKKRDFHCQFPPEVVAFPPVPQPFYPILAPPPFMMPPGGFPFGGFGGHGGPHGPPQGLGQVGGSSGGPGSLGGHGAPQGQGYGGTGGPANLGGPRQSHGQSRGSSGAPGSLGGYPGGQGQVQASGQTHRQSGGPGTLGGPGGHPGTRGPPQGIGQDHSHAAPHRSSGGYGQSRGSSGGSGGHGIPQGQGQAHSGPGSLGGQSVGGSRGHSQGHGAPQGGIHGQGGGAGNPRGQSQSHSAPQGHSQGHVPAEGPGGQIQSRGSLGGHPGGHGPPQGQAQSHGAPPGHAHQRKRPVPDESPSEAPPLSKRYPPY